MSPLALLHFPLKPLGLPPIFEEAAVDLERFCALLGTSSLSRDQFSDIIDALPSSSSSSSDGLFDRLLQMCRDAESIALDSDAKRDKKTTTAIATTVKSAALQSNEIDGTALRRLYGYHPAYTTCHNVMDTALRLTDHVKDMLQKSEQKPDAQQIAHTAMNRCIRLPKTIMASSDVPCLAGLDSDTEATDEVTDDDDEQLEVVEFDNELDLEMFASSLLRYDRPTAKLPADSIESLFHGVLLETIFDPLLSDSNAFVAALDDATLNHDALKHHVLTSLSMGSWGGLPGTVKYLSYFLDAYRYFTSAFCIHLTQTVDLVGRADPTGHHLEVLEENMEEEQGEYDDETIAMIREIGLDPSPLYGVPHTDLFAQCNNGLRQLSHSMGAVDEGVGLTEEECRHIAEPLVTAFEDACDPGKGATAATAISAMYFGSELICARYYSKLSAFLVALAGKKENEQECPVTKQHLAFFLLHIDMDVEHADKMRDIVVYLASDEATRLQMVRAVDAILKARVEFCDRFVESVFPPTGHSGEDSAKLYNKQSQNWVRKGPTCLSDFTGRPVVFEMCGPFAPGAHVLDVGCGEGYGARRIMEMGAQRIVGLDVSGEMIERAKANPKKSSQETYETCDAESIVAKLTEMPASLGLVPGRMLKEGCFDLAIAIFLFNYTSISKMKTICEQIFQTLKPGGHFVFSVPHPGMLNAHGGDESRGSTFSFANGDAKKSDYFSLRDRKFAGVIRTLDGRDLNVKMIFKAISDYTGTMSSVGFDILKMHEARVLPEHVAAHPEFFASVRDSPLHIVFDVVKPLMCAEVGRIPRAIRWSSFERANANRILTIAMPESVSIELVDFAIATYAKGITEETFSPTNEDRKLLINVSSFAETARIRLRDQTGAVHITGLDVDKLGKDADNAAAVGRAKLAYYIMSSHIGKVDGSARGRLFDVIDKGLDAAADNVLFSVTAASAPYHTDGASADKSYNVVGLFCINPALEGGKLHLSNAAAALGCLQNRMPKFVLNELLRPLPRDILENGSGEGVGRDDLSRLSRRPDLLKKRIHHNAYPIYEDGKSGRNDLVRFRYMRDWIESGHLKGCISLSPLLQLAMDSLDSVLEEEKIASIKMQTGDIVYCNNMSFAHSRDSFVNKAGDAPRHMVRVWLRM